MSDKVFEANDYDFFAARIMTAFPQLKKLFTLDEFTSVVHAVGLEDTRKIVGILPFPVFGLKEK